MIATISRDLTRSGLALTCIGANYWEVRKSGDSELIAKIGLKDFKETGPAAFLEVEQHLTGSMAWIAEAMRAVMDYAFDELKLGKISVRASIEQLSLLAALEDYGFVEKSRSYEGKKIRLVADRWDYIRSLAETEMLERLEDRDWSFGFDSGRRRAGLCSYTDKRITVSKYLALVHSVDDVMQTVLHEIAHALCGPKEGHGKKWLATAKRIGYRNDKYTGEEIAQVYAPYKGLCPNGHEHYRYQRPKRLYSCHHCASGFNKLYMIDWVARAS
jgi:predicted SprT family Zn-dependent metalloprotease